jgi:hypothetical protein
MWKNKRSRGGCIYIKYLNINRVYYFYIEFTYYVCLQLYIDGGNCGHSGIIDYRPFRTLTNIPYRNNMPTSKVSRSVRV